MLVFEERGKQEYLEKNLSEQRREPTTNSTHVWRQRQDLNPGHSGRRRVLCTTPTPCCTGNNAFCMFQILAVNKRQNFYSFYCRVGPCKQIKAWVEDGGYLLIWPCTMCTRKAARQVTFFSPSVLKRVYNST